MRTSTKFVAFACATGLFVTGAVAQHEDHQSGQPDTPKTTKMMSHMQQMKMGQDETRKLLDQLLTTFAAIETEKDPAALKQKLAEHGALLKQLQTKAQAHAHMMDMHMMDKNATPGEPKR
jgi:hypothetical protein